MIEEPSVEVRKFENIAHRKLITPQQICSANNENVAKELGYCFKTQSLKLVYKKQAEYMHHYGVRPDVWFIKTILTCQSRPYKSSASSNKV